MYFRNLVINTADGLKVAEPSIEFLKDCEAKGIDVEAVIADWAFKHPGSVLLKPTETSKSRVFRAAWKLKPDNSGIEIDMTKARVIAHDKRRARREALLAPHDKLATSPVTAIKNKANADKQSILDADAPIQVAIDAATTPEQMEQILINYQAV